VPCIQHFNLLCHCPGYESISYVVRRESREYGFVTMEFVKKAVQFPDWSNPMHWAHWLTTSTPHTSYRWTHLIPTPAS
jgi:hypothetical protein